MSPEHIWDPGGGPGAHIIYGIAPISLWEFWGCVLFAFRFPNIFGRLCGASVIVVFSHEHIRPPTLRKGVHHQEQARTLKGGAGGALGNLHITLQRLMGVWWVSSLCNLVSRVAQPDSAF